MDAFALVSAIILFAVVPCCVVWYVLRLAGLHSSRQWHEFDESKFQAPQTTILCANDILQLYAISLIFVRAAEQSIPLCKGIDKLMWVINRLREIDEYMYLDQVWLTAVVEGAVNTIKPTSLYY